MRDLVEDATVVLERLTKPFDLIEADEGCGERGEGEVDVGPPIVSRTARRRKRAIQAKVRSTTQRRRPSLALLSTPGLAMRGAMCRRRRISRTGRPA